MIKSIRILNTSDGGNLEIGASEKSIIEVGGQRFALAMLATLADPKNVGATFAITSVGGVVAIEAHSCPKPEPDENPAPKRGRHKEVTEE